MLGSGFVADFYMQGLADVNGQEVVVNYSRNAGEPANSPRKWAIPEPASDLEMIIGRTDIDLYIIALPNEPTCRYHSRCPKPGKTRYARNRWDEQDRRAS